VVYNLLILKLSRKSTHNVLSYLANTQTDRQTNSDEDSTSTKRGVKQKDSERRELTATQPTFLC